MAPKPAQAVITDGAPAIDMLGQLDYTYGSEMRPDFNNYMAHGGPFPFSVNRSMFMEMDTVNHRMFVIDAYNNRVLIHQLDSNNDLIDISADYVLGQEDLYSSHYVATPTASSLRFPTGLAWDAANERLFVSDGNTNRILVFDLSSGITNGMDASYVLGQEDFTSGGIGLAADRFYEPYGLAWDSTGELLYAADYRNNRLLVFDLSSGITNGMDASNVLGQANFTSNSANRGGSPAANTISRANAVTLDSANDRLWVVDHINNRVLVYDISSGITDGMDATYVLGQADFTGGDINRGGSVAANTMYYPFDAKVDTVKSRVFVTDDGNARVLIFDISSGITNGMNASNVLGQVNFTSSADNRGGSPAANTLKIPLCAMWDSADERLWVTDLENYRMLSYDLSGGITDGMAADTVLGQPTSVSSTYPTTGTGQSFTTAVFQGTLTNFGVRGPHGVHLDLSGQRLFVADRISNRVLVFDTDSSGVPLDRRADYVLGQSDFNSDGATTTATGLYEPFDVDYDSTNSRLFVADYRNNRVLVYDLSGGITTGMAATYALGQANLTSGAANRGGSVAANTLYQPSGVNYDSSSSTLWVNDAINSRVLAYDLSSGVTTGMAAANVLGQANFTSGSLNRGGSPANNTLYYPLLSKYDQVNSRLLVSDTYNQRVLVYDLSGGVTDGMAAANVLGQSNFTSNSSNRGGSVAANTLSYPFGVEYDSTNDTIWVADYNNNRTLAYDISGGITDGMNASNVLGQTDMTSNTANPGYSVTKYSSSQPTGIHLNSALSQLVVAEYSNNRVLVYDASASTGTTDNTTNNRISLSRLAAGESAVLSLEFDLAHVISTTLTVTFPAGFTVTSPATTAGGASSSCLSNFGYTSNTLTADKSNCGGPITLGGATVTLPSSPGSYTITWVNDDPGEATVIIVGNDQVAVNATVYPTLSFLALAQPAASTCSNDVDLTGSDYAVDLGALNVSTLTESESQNADSETVERVCVQGSTPSAGGIVVTVKSANGSSGLVSASVPADAIASSTTGQITAGTPGYGICVVGSSLGSDAGLTPPSVDPTASGDFATYPCEDAEGNVVALDGTAQSIIGATGPTQDATASIWVRVAISATQPAHNDYTDSLTFVGTATY